MSKNTFSALLLLLIFSTTATAQTQKITHPDSLFSLEVPADWYDAELGSDVASIQMANTSDDAFFIVISENKDDLFGWNMARYIYVTLGQGVAGLNFPEVSPIEYIELDGSPTARVIVSGATSGHQFVYTRYAIDGPTHMIQLIFGCKKSVYEQKKAVFESAIQSLDLF